MFLWMLIRLPSILFFSLYDRVESLFFLCLMCAGTFIELPPPIENNYARHDYSVI